MTWFKLFYTNISRLYPKQWLVFWVLLFESLSETGMPALPVSLFLCSEVLANAVRKDENIRGINIANVECKLSQQADDTTIILNGSELSLSRTLLFLDNFAISSRLKVSCEKTEKLWIGSCKDSPYQTICILKLILKYLKCIFSIWTLFSCILIWHKNLNFRPCLKYILSVVKLYFIKRKTLSSIYNVFCLTNMIKIGYLKCIFGIEPLTLLQTEFK